jgi:hypothetical protein
VDHGGSDHPRVAVADEGHGAQVLEMDQVGYIIDVCMQIDVFLEKMTAVSTARQCGGVHHMLFPAQQGGHLLPDPTPLKCSVHQHVRRHLFLAVPSAPQLPHTPCPSPDSPHRGSCGDPLRWRRRRGIFPSAPLSTDVPGRSWCSGAGGADVVCQILPDIHALHC